MTPCAFPEANSEFGPPEGMAESQVSTVPAWRGTQHGGSCDGTDCVVVAWKPSAEELDRLRAGSLIYLTVLGWLPPHCLTTSFQEARAVA